jgi:hypothetical protein
MTTFRAASPLPINNLDQLDSLPLILLAVVFLLLWWR